MTDTQVGVSTDPTAACRACKGDPRFGERLRGRTFSTKGINVLAGQPRTPIAREKPVRVSSLPLNWPPELRTLNGQTRVVPTDRRT
jgi:hypothetical protein